jgi:transposase
MLKMEEFFVLKDLYEQGMKISDISRSTGIDRKTVRKYVHSSSLPESVSRSVIHSVVFIGADLY